METKENKYPYLGAADIEQVKKETTEEILQRLNNSEKRYKRLYWDCQHWGTVIIQIFKNGIEVQKIELNEEDTANGFDFADIKSIANDLENMYQDYKSLTEVVIKFKSEWDERQ